MVGDPPDTHAIKSRARVRLLLRPLGPAAVGASPGRFVAVPRRALRRWAEPPSGCPGDQGLQEPDRDVDIPDAGRCVTVLRVTSASVARRRFYLTSVCSMRGPGGTGSVGSAKLGCR